jgi:fumarate reductase subunit C
MKIGMENAKNGTVGQKYTPTAKVMEFNITNKSVGGIA